MNRGWLAVGAIALSMVAASCASLPTSGSIPIKAFQESGVQGQTGVEVEPVPPGRNWTPREIVEGFLAASASFGKHHRVARDYLTLGFAKTWRPGWGATVVDDPNPVPSTIPHNVVTGGPQRSAVSVSGKRFATLLTAGQDQAGSVVVAPADTVFRFSLVLQDGQWRIDSIDEGVTGKPSKPAPKSLLLLTRPDFERDYLARNIYFFPAYGSSPRMLVPDPVYIPQTGLVAEVRGLVSALIQPRCRAKRESTGSNCPTNPPDTSWLFGAAETAFPPGVRTVRPVQVIGGVKAIVDLGNTAAQTSPAQRKRMAAQLAWSLTESPYGAQTSQIRSVVLKFARRSMTASLQLGWVPRTEGTSLYYQVPGTPDQSSHVVIQAPKVQPFSINLARQAGSRPFTTMAVSPTPSPPTTSSRSASPPSASYYSEVLAGCAGKKLYLIPFSAPQQVTTVRLPSPCTSLSWDPSGNLWIAATSGTFEIPGAGSTPPRDALISVVQPNPEPVRTLRVAPDGVRVAMIVLSGQTSKIMIAAISKSSRFTYIAQTAEMLRVGSDLQHPLALSWLDPDHLLVLDQVHGRKEIYEVPLNGGASTEITTPPGVTSLSATWPEASQNPQVAVGIRATAGAPAKIEMSQAPLISPDWRPVSTGTTPVFPG